jgi:hypothetical protein
MKESWGSAESKLNQVGTVLVGIIPMLAALLISGLFPFDVRPAILFAVVIVCGVVGGALNLLGRGPLLVGAIVGLAIALGGFSAVYGWAQLRENLFWFEVVIAYVLGTMPGFLLQRALQGKVGR